MTMKAGLTYISFFRNRRRALGERLGTYEHDGRNYIIQGFERRWHTEEEDHDTFGPVSRRLWVHGVDVANIERNATVMKNCSHCVWQLASVGLYEANNCISVPMYLLWHASAEGNRLSLAQLREVHMLQIPAVPDFLLTHMEGVTEG
jgi:hypothetical protein